MTEGERHREGGGKEKEINFLSARSLQQLGLAQAKPRSWGLCWSPHEWQGPKSLGHLSLPPYAHQQQLQLKSRSAFSDRAANSPQIVNWLIVFVLNLEKNGGICFCLCLLWC